MATMTERKSLKEMTRDQIMAETDHFFTRNGLGDVVLSNHGSNGGPECFLLNEREFQLVNELEALENHGTLKQQQAVVLQIRAVIRSIQALGCANTVEYPR